MGRIAALSDFPAGKHSSLHTLNVFDTVIPFPRVVLKKKNAHKCVSTYFLQVRNKKGTREEVFWK